ncbi:MAG: methyltransferase domain-containing protein [Deinococcus-Thermus bacterium]|jgi:SAM-dependent methyltransferase|nr:methyltransferase domain-containing protein [Deinococcota bacterium]
MTDSAFWDRLAPRYARLNLADPDAYAATLDRARAHLAPGDRVLEIGCGTGTTAIALAPAVARYEATDYSAAMIGIAEGRAEAAGLPGLSFRVAAHDDPGTADDTPHDAILALNLLHLLPDLPGALAGLRARLAPGGRLISKTPCLADLSPVLRVVVPALRLVGKAPRVAWLTAAELERQIAAAGFDVIETADQPARRAQRLVIARVA